MFKATDLKPKTKMAAASVKIDDGAGYHAPNPNRREWIGRFFSKLGKFAVDSAVNNNSLLQLKGKKKGHDIVQEELKVEPTIPCLNVECRDNDQQLAQKTQAKLEQNLEEMNVVKPRIETAHRSVSRLTPLEKMPNEGIWKSDQTRTNGRKIFIRSRL